jgi:hypothetical protein
MAKYTVEHTCGHTQVYQLYGKSSERTRKLEWLADQICTECKREAEAKARADASAQAAAAAEENGFPRLQGTEKQIAWAETIRRDRLNRLRVIEEAIEEARKIPDQPAGALDVMADAIIAIKGQDSAHWWIEHRDSSLFSDTYDFQIWLLGGSQYAKLSPAEMVARARQHFGGLPRPVDETPPAEIIADAKAEATVRPESSRTETVAEIAIDGNAIKVTFPEKREDFRQLIRFELGFAWADTHWRRALGKTAGTPADRAAEVGHRLLAAGFIIRIYDPAIRASSVAGDYAPERTRWVMARTSGRYAGHFSISWGKNDDFYAVAKKLPRAVYNEKTVIVPAEFFEEILDFAQRHDFELSDGAQKLVAQARANKEAAMIAKVKPTPKREKMVADTAPPKLDVPENPEIDDDLRDGD